ncbi:MEDS domain-containing protein [Allokutzneria oryzae]|uniref:MEDS domain-containing protein n=1 Tax=Allokutzneria oryzae TaxID=1378989 RepID=A0ABV6ACI5_9PSEU
MAGDHLCLSFAADDENRQALVVQFVAALEHGDKIAYVTDDASSDGFLSWIADAGPGVESVIARGQAVVLPTTELALTRDAFDVERVLSLLSTSASEAASDGFGGLRACVDMRAVSRGTGGVAGVVEYEQRLRTLFAEDRPAGLTLACHYDEREFSRDLMDTVRRQHTVALTAEQVQQREPVIRMTPLSDVPGLRLAGELDKSNIAELYAALETAFRDDREFHLDLTAVHYADVTAVSTIARVASGLCVDCRFVLRSPAPIIRTILRIYGWDQLPALRLVEGMTN